MQPRYLIFFFNVTVRLLFQVWFFQLETHKIYGWDGHDNGKEGPCPRPASVRRCRLLFPAIVQERIEEEEAVGPSK